MSDFTEYELELLSGLAAANQKILEQQAVIDKLRPKYSDIGSRDVETTAMNKLIDNQSQALTDHVNKEVVKVLEEAKSRTTEAHVPCAMVLGTMIAERSK